QAVVIVGLGAAELGHVGLSVIEGVHHGDAEASLGEVPALGRLGGDFDAHTLDTVGEAGGDTAPLCAHGVAGAAEVGLGERPALAWDGARDAAASGQSRQQRVVKLPHAGHLSALLCWLELAFAPL